MVYSSRGLFFVFIICCCRLVGNIVVCYYCFFFGFRLMELLLEVISIVGRENIVKVILIFKIFILVV